MTDGMRNLYLGVDTSNYTTSLALYSDSNGIIANIKRLLPVGKGERGLRQSDAVFAHVKAIPELCDELVSVLESARADGYNIAAVGCSVSPRDADGSYMPCFLAGISAAKLTAASLGVPLYCFSHQCGHIMAALYSSGTESLMSEQFAAFHVSGGTTEVLLCEPDDERIFRITKLGGTLDLNAGQVIDRCGVAMGLTFPAGAAMEQLALEADGKIPQYKESVHGMECNLSGLENKAAELYRTTNDSRVTSAYVLGAVASTLEKMSAAVREKYGDIPLIYAGGVMSCSIIKDRLKKYSAGFAEPRFSSDNAAGIARLAAYRHSHDTEEK